MRLLALVHRGYSITGSVEHPARPIAETTGDRNSYGFRRDRSAAYKAEGGVTAFKREADERGTPYIEVDPEVTAYIDTRQDACVKEMFSRMAKREGPTAALFPFQRLSHSFLVGSSRKFDAECERKANQNMRTIINTVKERVQSLVDPTNASAVAKAAHYLSALDAQLEVCDGTDEFIDMLTQPIGGRRVSDF